MGVREREPESSEGGRRRPTPWVGLELPNGWAPSPASDPNGALGLGGLGLLVFYNIFSRYKVIKSVPSNGIKCL